MRARPAPLSRLAVLVLLVLLVVGAAVVFVGPAGSRAADPPVTSESGAAAAGWLARQMVDGERFETDFGDGMVYPDQGLTVDAVLALAAAGVAGENGNKALAWLATPDVLAGFVGDGATESYAGQLAKLMLAAQAWGADPAAFGGVDLGARLTALLADSGRFVDLTASTDLSNAFSQAFAVLALERAGSAPPSAVTYLAGTACPSGGFPLYLEQDACAPDVDSTAMVVQALLAAADTESATAGLDWLASQQQPDGGFGGSGPTSGENANSTGLAAEALRVGGRDLEADRAVAFLEGLQIGCDAPADQRGGVAYDMTGFDPGNAVRATAQAVLGFTGVGLAVLDGTTAAPAAPVLECADTPSGSPTPSVSPSVSPSASASPSATPSLSPSPSLSASPPASPIASAPAPSATSAAPVIPPPTDQALPPPTGGLPTTGQPIADLALVGAALLLAGGIAVAAARIRRRAGDPAP